MNSEAEYFKIKMTHSELWDTAFDVQLAIEYTLKTHWINHQNAWLNHEEGRLNRSKMMFTALGRPELHESIFATAKKIFEDHNSKKKNNQPLVP